MSDIFWSNWPFKVLIKKGYSLCKKWNFKVNFEVVMHPPSIFVVYYIFWPPPWPDAKKNHCYDFRHTGGILRSKIFRVGIQFLAPISIFRGPIHWVTGVLLTHFRVLYLISHCVTAMGLIRWVTVGATYRDNWEVGSDFHLMKKKTYFFHISY